MIFALELIISLFIKTCKYCNTKNIKKSIYYNYSQCANCSTLHNYAFTKLKFINYNILLNNEKYSVCINYMNNTTIINYYPNNSIYPKIIYRFDYAKELTSKEATALVENYIFI